MRIDLIKQHHEAQAIDLPNAPLHAVTHLVVENQIAEGDALPVRQQLQQLMAQGLDRHDAIHAIGAVLMGHLNDLTTGRITDADPNRRYYSALRRLSARQWLRSAGR